MLVSEIFWQIIWSTVTITFFSLFVKSVFSANQYSSKMGTWWTSITLNKKCTFNISDCRWIGQ
jgi:hypothetical protein